MVQKLGYIVLYSIDGYACLLYLASEGFLSVSNYFLRI